MKRSPMVMPGGEARQGQAPPRGAAQGPRSGRVRGRCRRVLSLTQERHSSRRSALCECIRKLALLGGPPEVDARPGSVRWLGVCQPGGVSRWLVCIDPRSPLHDKRMESGSNCRYIEFKKGSRPNKAGQATKREAKRVLTLSIPKYHPKNLQGSARRKPAKPAVSLVSLKPLD
jgi:hypothetical protein